MSIWYLRRLVPGCETFDREVTFMILFIQFDSQSEITNLHNALCVDQNIGRLDILC
jgi:hypothetical protein